MLVQIDLGRQCAGDITLKRVRATPVVVEKTVSITCSEYVFVALVIQPVIRMRRALICGLPLWTIFFHIIS